VRPIECDAGYVPLSGKVFQWGYVFSDIVSLSTFVQEIHRLSFQWGYVFSDIVSVSEHALEGR